jgi:beta-N-acetylhexosaminidase
LYKGVENTFFQTLNSKLDSPEFAFENFELSDLKSIKKDVEKFETIIISLFVPKAKPQNNFEINDEVLDLLSNLLQTKKCILYVFGNPYVLPIIPNIKVASGLIEVYQDFNEFQKNAGIQLLKNTTCYGKLPVNIDLQ